MIFFKPAWVLLNFFINWDSSVSSNINEVVKAVLNSLLFFYQKISHAPKAQKAPKSTKSTKSTKRHKDTQAKTRNAKNECFSGALFIFVGL